MKSYEGGLIIRSIVGEAITDRNRQTSYLSHWHKPCLVAGGDSATFRLELWKEMVCGFWIKTLLLAYTVVYIFLSFVSNCSTHLNFYI